MEDYERERRYTFFLTLKESLESIRLMAKELDLEDDYAMFFIGGLYSSNDTDDEGNTPFQAMSDFYVEDEAELDELLSVGVEIYQKLEGDRVMKESRRGPDTEGWSVDDWMSYIDRNTDPSEPKN